MKNVQNNTAAQLQQEILHLECEHRKQVQSLMHLGGQFEADSRLLCRDVFLDLYLHNWGYVFITTITHLLQN